MAKPEEKPAFMNCSPIREHEEEENDIDGYEETVSARGCGCLRLFCFEWRRQSSDGDNRNLLQQKETWLVKKVKEAKEVSERVAGPKWKNFIRKISKYFSQQKAKTQFQYDPHSYALNFDDGFDHEEEDGLLLGPSSAGHFSGEERRVLL
uniref:Putative stress induced protein n=1 Tax=Davidia involucrata TaxID=16924 RepID=A0A5B7BTZ2_DAVIN